jgi:hypothetical protein
VSDQVDLTPALEGFLRDNVESLDQLDLLSLMVKLPDRWWDAASAGEALRISTVAARAALEALASRNLLEISLTTDIRYRFQPGTPVLREHCDAFAEAYRMNPLAIVRFFTDTHRRAVRDFADAFRLRRS